VEVLARPSCEVLRRRDSEDLLEDHQDLQVALCEVHHDQGFIPEDHHHFKADHRDPCWDVDAVVVPLDLDLTTMT